MLMLGLKAKFLGLKSGLSLEFVISALNELALA